jgi:hypothetical protein
MFGAENIKHAKLVAVSLRMRESRDHPTYRIGIFYREIASHAWTVARYSEHSASWDEGTYFNALRDAQAHFDRKVAEHWEQVCAQG